MKTEKSAYQHDYDVSNLEYWTRSTAITTSLGIYQLIPNAKGDGLKRTAVKVRVKGYTSEWKKIMKKADEIVDLLDEGKYDGPKTITVK